MGIERIFLCLWRLCVLGVSAVPSAIVISIYEEVYDWLVQGYPIIQMVGDLTHLVSSGVARSVVRL